MGTLSFFSQIKSPLAWSGSLFSCFLSFVGGQGLEGESCVSLADELSVVLFEVSGSLVGGRGMGACLPLPGREEGILVRSEKEGAYCPGDVSALALQCPGAWQLRSVTFLWGRISFPTILLESGLLGSLLGSQPASLSGACHFLKAAVRVATERLQWVGGAKQVPDSSGRNLTPLAVFILTTNRAVFYSLI